MKRIAAILVLLGLLCLLSACSWSEFAENWKKMVPNPSPAVSTAPTAAPSAAPEEAPAPTSAPAPEPTPAPAEEPVEDQAYDENSLPEIPLL